MSDYVQRMVEVSEGVLIDEQDMPVIDVELEGGGVVTLLFSGNLFALSLEDRAFVFGLVDRFREYRFGPPEIEQDRGESVAPIEEPAGVEVDSIAAEPPADPGTLEEVVAPAAPPAGENPAPDPEPEIFVCRDCDARFATQHRLGVHRSHNHEDRAETNLEEIPCAECGQKCRGQVGLAAHRRHRHSEPVGENVVPALPPVVVTVKPGVAEMLAAAGAVGPDGHVHRWLLGAPIGDWVHGTCRDCSAIKSFPANPLGHAGGWKADKLPERAPAG